MKIWGWQDNRISGLNDNLFAIIQSADDKENLVRAKIVTTSRELGNHYTSTFAGDGGDNKNSTVAGILQGGIWANEFESLKKFENRTLITKAQSLQIWTGFQGQSAPLELEFVAWSKDKAYDEVEGAIAMLEKWTSPQLNDSFVESAKNAIQNLMSGDSEVDDNVFGFTPVPLSISILSKRYDSLYVIQGLSQSQSEMFIMDNGNRTKQTVSLSLVSRTGLSKDQFKM